MTADTQHRVPAGAPTGGQFAVTGRAEPTLSLAPCPGDDGMRADHALTVSILEAASLDAQIHDARRRVGATRARQLLLEVSADPHSADAEQSVVAAEADLGELLEMRASTVPGLAELQRRVDDHERALHGPLDTADHERHRMAAGRARVELERAAAYTDLVPVPDANACGREAWPGIAMVAAPVTGLDASEPVAYRVSFLSAAGGSELGRVTVEGAAAGRALTRSTVVRAVIALATSEREDPDAAAARAVCDTAADWEVGA